MKYWNPNNCFVVIGPRESVPPYGLSRDLTEEEVEKNSDLRYAIKDRGYLTPWDGKTPLPKTARVPQPSVKPKYTIAPDSIGGKSVTKKTSSGKSVEYVVADVEGTDNVSNAASDPEVFAALPEESKPTDFIEEGVSGRNEKGAMKTNWQNASEAFEDELTRETTEELEYDDNDNLSEGDEKLPEIPDADDEIAKDATQILVDQGKMGSTLKSVPEVVKDAVDQAAHTLKEAVTVNVDDGEVAEGVSEETARFLKQPFAAKKWTISKTSDKGFLAELESHTQSDNLRAIVKQRMSELEDK